MREPDEVVINGKTLEEILEVPERADLNGADLSNVNLYGANLCGARLYCTDLSGTDLRNTDLRIADLRGACLCNANICGADLWGARLSGAKLDYVKYNHTTSFFEQQCPKDCDYVGWKKCVKFNNGIMYDYRKYIVKLRITEDAKRSSATSTKCRASKAEVLEILNLDGTKSPLDRVCSCCDFDFIYEVGKIVEVHDFDPDRWNECSTGIHHFMSFQEAVDY